jgi:hypothetical protein
MMDDRDAGYDPEVEAAAAALEREAEELRRQDMEAKRQPMRPMPRQRSMPVSAPVSRDSPSISTGRPQSIGTSVTLSAAEREIARDSFSDPSMSVEDRERLYAMNKRKMLLARANGTLNE